MNTNLFNFSSKLTRFNNIKDILYKFPKNFKVNNNIIINNYINIDANYFVVKPKGISSYLWFTYYENNFVCILIFLNSSDILSDKNEFYYYFIDFCDELCFNNTLVHGYYIYSNKKNLTSYFIIDNIVNYNNFNYIIQSEAYKEYLLQKLNIYDIILNKIVCQEFYKIKIPLIVNNINDLYINLYKLNYNIYSITCYSKNKYLGNYLYKNINNLNTKNLNNNFQKETIANFRIEPCIEQDMYRMFIINDLNKEKNEEFYDYALINNYKTSVIMNNIFRKIKENKNLDFLEESDSDGEFEDISPYKFINQNIKNDIIECYFNNKFKKWIPINLAKNNIIIKKSLLINLFKLKKKYFHNI